jgi:diketogulonate reductase-like aldo/keto reductase
MIPSLTLKNGVKMPVLGLGTWQLEGKECVEAVQAALRLGYTHIDTAEMYGNQREIGVAIRGHDRKRLFITSKVWYTHLRKKDVIAACTQTLKELGTPYLDLYLIHWPNSAVPLRETFEALKELYDDGKVRAVGVSNFTVRHVEEALKASKVDICVNQVEFHPLLYQQELLGFCDKHHIRLTAYSPLGRGAVLKDATVAEIAAKHGKTAAQVALRWLYEKGAIVIPKGSSEEHLRENMAIFDFELTKEEAERLDSLSRRRIIRPPFAEFGE